MRFRILALRVVGVTWLIAAGVVIALGTVSVWVEDGFAGVGELLSPFNVLNWLVTVALLAPGVLLLMMSNKLKSKSQRK